VTAATAPTTAERRAAVPVAWRAALVLLVASAASLVAFAWPLFVDPGAGIGHASDAPFVFVIILPVLLAVIVTEVSAGGIDAKALAMLGVLSGLGAALRLLGAGTAGIETSFFLLVVAGRVFGPGFGFVLGSTSLFASALVTGGFGPWLPFQMLAASWVGLGAGLLPPVRGRLEILMLMAYGAVAALAFGLLMNLWFWPFVVGGDSTVSYVAGAPVGENLTRLLLFSLATSMAWDVGRAITTVVLLALAGAAILATLRRAARRAAFGAGVEFSGTRPARQPNETSSTFKS
jgi:energy-coupling factor transport system substrate-specific component